MPPQPSIDFDTGKLSDVARADRPNRRREYTMLRVVVLLTALPWLACALAWPVPTLIVFAFAGYFQVLVTFATSTTTDTSHHIRFLLCGSNPIGMTGASSLVFGGVDSIIDWREDRGERSRSPVKFWLLSIYKFAMTPAGVLLMAMEFVWDAVLMRRPSLVGHKWRELFSLAWYHSLICPEKSNDIFYADMAFARYNNDPYLYQWNRLRAMVFELEHYRQDVVRGLGVPETNLFLQDEVTAYQTLKRLRLEEIEAAVEAYYKDNVEQFPVPPALAEALVRNAKPIRHYLRMRQQLVDEKKLSGDSFLAELIPDSHVNAVHERWKLLRAMDGDGELADPVRDKIEAAILGACNLATSEEAANALLETVPRVVSFDGQIYVSRSPTCE